MIIHDSGRLVCIEYQARRPFSAITEENGIQHQWDFEWCRRDKRVYYHMSGSGGPPEVRLHALVDPRKPAEIWVAEGVPILKYVGRTGKTKAVRDDAEILRLGYRRLKLPRLFNGNRNPFDACLHSEGKFCEGCKDDWIPYEHPCEHLA